MVLEAGASLPSRLQGRLLPALSGLRELLASPGLQSWPLSHQGPLPVITETTPSVPAPRRPCPQGTGRGSGPPCCSGSSLVTSAKTISKQGLVHRCRDQDLTVLGTQFSAPAWLLRVTGEHKSLHSSRSSIRPGPSASPVWQACAGPRMCLIQPILNAWLARAARTVARVWGPLLGLTPGCLHLGSTTLWGEVGAQAPLGVG